MALPINVSDLINRRVIESARIEYKGDWNPEPILTLFVLLQMILTTGVAATSLLELRKKAECRNSRSKA